MTKTSKQLRQEAAEARAAGLHDKASALELYALTAPGGPAHRVTTKTYRVEAIGFFGRQRTFMSIEVQAPNKKKAIADVRKRDNRDYFDRHDYEAGTLRWTATEVEGEGA